MTPELRAGLFELSLDDLHVVTPVAAAAPATGAQEATLQQDEEKQLQQQTRKRRKRKKLKERQQQCKEKEEEMALKKRQEEAAGEGEKEEDAMSFILSMGFDRDLARQAVARFPKDRMRAVDWLLCGCATAAHHDDCGDDGNDGDDEKEPHQTGATDLNSFMEGLAHSLFHSCHLWSTQLVLACVSPALR